MTLEHAKRAIIDKVDEVAEYLTHAQVIELLDDLASDFELRAEGIREEEF